MCISRKAITKMKIYIDGKRIDQVTQFRYLGNGKSDNRRWILRERDRNGKENISRQEEIVRWKDESRNKEKNNQKCLVWSVALYAAETWILTQADIEMWIWRRMEKIRWLDKVIANKDVLKKVNESKNTLNVIIRQRTAET